MTFQQIRRVGAGDGIALSRAHMDELRRGASSEPAPQYLLDLYPGAGLALALRPLNSSYSGPAIRVRRESDNAEQDIGFSATGLDEAALIAFCDTADGRVTRWFDQSGNGFDAVQSDPENQPFIVIGGQIQKMGAQPAIQFYDLRQLIISQKDIFSFADPQPYSLMYVCVTFQTRFAGTISNGPFWVNWTHMLNRDGLSAYHNNVPLVSAAGTVPTGSVNLITQTYNGTGTTTAWSNNSQIIHSTSHNLSGSSDTLHIGASSYSYATLQGAINDILIYPSDQTTNRPAIATNLMTHYGLAE